VVWEVGAGNAPTYPIRSAYRGGQRRLKSSYKDDIAATARSAS
jgi:hypothetical protein